MNDELTKNNEEARLLQTALKAINSDNKTTDDPALQELREAVERADIGIIDRIKKEGLPSIDECVTLLRGTYELGKQLHSFATKMGWIGVRK